MKAQKKQDHTAGKERVGRLGPFLLSRGWERSALGESRHFQWGSLWNTVELPLWCGPGGNVVRSCPNLKPEAPDGQLCEPREREVVRTKVTL